MINISPEHLSRLRQSAPATPSYAMPQRSGYSRFDPTQKGAGLASEGYSIDRPDEAFAYYKRMQSNPHNVNETNLLKNVQRYAANNKGSWEDPRYVTQALDWHFRNQQRNNQKVHSPLGPLGAIAPIAAGFIPGIGPGLSAAIGAGFGGLTGGWKGALLGGLSSAIGPSIKVGSIGNALKSPIATATNVAKQFSNPTVAARQIASSGISRLGGRRG